MYCFFFYRKESPMLVFRSRLHSFVFIPSCQYQCVMRKSGTWCSSTVVIRARSGALMWLGGLLYFSLSLCVCRLMQNSPLTRCLSRSACSWTPVKQRGTRQNITQRHPALLQTLISSAHVHPSIHHIGKGSCDFILKPVHSILVTR